MQMGMYNSRSDVICTKKGIPANIFSKGFKMCDIYTGLTLGLSLGIKMLALRLLDLNSISTK